MSLELDAEVNSNPLILQCSKHSSDINTIRNLLNSDIDPFIVDSYGRSPLILYLYHSIQPDPDIITLLIETSHMNQLRNKPDFRMTALLYAFHNDQCCSGKVFQILSSLPIDGDSNKTKLNYQYIERKYFNLIDLYQDGGIRPPSDSRLSKRPYYPPIHDFVAYIEEQFYSQTYQSNLNEQTSVYHSLEEYIIETDNPDANVISKIIEAYRETRDMSYISSRNRIYYDISSRRVNLSLMDALNVFYVAAAKRCSIEVFQVLLFDYGIDIASQFDVKLMDVLAGNYTLYTDTKLIHTLIPLKSNQNILLSYLTGKNTLNVECPLNSINHIEHGTSVVTVISISDNILETINIPSNTGTNSDIHVNIETTSPNPQKPVTPLPIDLDTFKYLTTIVNLSDKEYRYFNHERNEHVTDRVFLAPLMGLMNSPIIFHTDLLLYFISLFSETDINFNNFNQDGNGKNALMEYIDVMSLNSVCDGESAYLDLRVVRALVKAGLDINYINYKFFNSTALMRAACSHSSNILEIFHTFIELGADIYLESGLRSKSLDIYLSKDLTEYSETTIEKYIETIISIMAMHDPKKMEYHFHKLFDSYLINQHILDQSNTRVLEAMLQLKIDNHRLSDDNISSLKLFRKYRNKKI